jgi:S1-C subfamily serine protease
MGAVMRAAPVPGWPSLLVAAAFAVLAGGPAWAQEKPALEQLVSSVVRIKTFIAPDGRTVENLGRERDGSGVVIDDSGLILTIGYLMVEAHAAQAVTNDGRAVPANVIGYDFGSGFGLLQAIAPLKLKPLALGKSADVKERDPVVIASFGGIDAAAPAYVMAKREFAGSWEYLLDEAIFTAPPHAFWSGAALISRDGRLAGIGSLMVSDTSGKGDGGPGNMFVPVDLLPPVLADLMAGGRPTAANRPWLGVNADDVRGRLLVSRVTVGGPGEKAGIRRGDVIVGVNGEAPKSLADFYRKVWALGAAGAVVPLDVQQGSDKVRIDVKSMNRLDHLKLKSTF